eukprot:gnl/MRDRNA2_/MRDRNA2_132406_c0_seq1.p1 gnl/MRDRNA2_/MRDRNA2_132406_c0~~gnl/MRDRNA2_/MRDRNA2_132406_c0_seq1.p1  ORF type:complete len:171 (+),score=62.19 gnl/MRDRNA2_/MRDRNA2_132406_c0_seq1:132-644(+)
MVGEDASLDPDGKSSMSAMSVKDKIRHFHKAMDDHAKWNGEARRGSLRKEDCDAVINQFQRQITTNLETQVRNQKTVVDLKTMDDAPGKLPSLEEAKTTLSVVREVRRTLKVDLNLQQDEDDVPQEQDQEQARLGEEILSIDKQLQELRILEAELVQQLKDAGEDDDEDE